MGENTLKCSVRVLQPSHVNTEEISERWVGKRLLEEVSRMPSFKGGLALGEEGGVCLVLALGGHLKQKE